MKIIALAPAQQAQVAALQSAFQTAQQAHVAAYRTLLEYLTPIAGTPAPEQGRKTRISISDDGQHLIIG